MVLRERTAAYPGQQEKGSSFSRRALDHDVSTYIYIPGELDEIYHFASPASPKGFSRIPIPILKVGALGTHNSLVSLASKVSALCSPPQARSTATHSSTPSRRSIRATSIR